MSEPKAAPQHQARGRYQALIVGLGLVLCLLLAACPLGAIAVQQRMIPPPRFVIRLGSTEISAPCPARMSVCDESTPWFAVWRGKHRPDGVRYEQLFFVYLRPARHR